MVEINLGNKIITVIVGIGGESPPRNIQISIEELANSQVNKETALPIGRDSVALTINENPTREQRSVLGDRVLHIQKFDVDIAREELDQDLVNAVHNMVVDAIDENGFNISGTATVWNGGLQNDG